jgi:hypothetical protein
MPEPGDPTVASARSRDQRRSMKERTAALRAGLRIGRAPRARVAAQPDASAQRSADTAPMR